MDLSPQKMADIALQALLGKQPLEAIAEENDVKLWQVVDWAIAIRQKGHQVFSASSQGSTIGNFSSDGLPWRTIFIHIQKTAGTTLTSYLEDAYQQNRICPVKLHHQLEELALKEDLTGFDLFCGHFHYGWFQENANFRGDTRYVTLLRDPVKRALSSYHHWMREPNRTYRYVSPLISDANVQCMYLSPLPMRSAHHSLQDHLNAAKEALDTFFFVGIQERFSESLELLHRTMGVAVPSDQRVKNTAEGQALVQLSAPLIEEIVEANWADTELYEYAKSLFELRLKREIDAPPKPLAFSPGPQQLPASICYRVTDPLNGSNWHEREGIGQEHQWRWSGPGTESCLNFRVCIDKDAEYRLSMHIINAMSAEILASMEVFINGVAIKLQEVRDDDNRFLLEGCCQGIDIASDSESLQVRIRVCKTLTHFDIDPNIEDKRQCGFALSELRLSLA